MNEFDVKAKGWDENPIHLERSRHIAKAIIEKLPLNKSMKALEYGSGTGLLSFELQDHFGSIIMTDSSDGMLKILNEKIKESDNPNLESMKLDLTRQHLENRKFNIIFTQMTLHHVMDIDGILSEFYSLLESDGYLCIADLDKEDGSFHGKEVTDVHHGFDRDKLAEQVKKAGFKDISFTTAFTMNRDMEYGKKSFPIFLMTAQKNIG